MGIYPERSTTGYERLDDGQERWTEIERTPGLNRRRTVVAQPWVDERTDCYCCSCGELEGSDAHCRNHGFDGRRPCELHQMPGQECHPEDFGVDGEPYMPASVQAYRDSRVA